MNRSTIVASLLVLLLLAIVAILKGQLDRSEATLVEPASSDAPSAASQLPGITPGEAVTDLEREEFAIIPEASSGAQPLENDISAPGMVTFVGRCIEAGTLRPLENIDVDLWVAFANRRLKTKYQDPEPEQPAPTLTGADGRFSIQGQLGGSYTYALSLGGTNHLQRQGRWSKQWTEELTIDLGDVVLPKGVLVKGIVLDQDGFPVPDFSVQVEGLPAGGNLLSTGVIYGRSDEDGNFTLNCGIPVGSWEIRGGKKGYAIEAPKVLEVPSSKDWVYLEVRAKSMPRFSGIILAREGKPIVGARLRTMRTGSGKTESARTNAQGEFTLFARRDSLEPIAIRIQAKGFATLQTNPYPWGTSGLAFILEPLPSISLLVREKGSDATVQNYDLWLGNELAEDHSFGHIALDPAKADGSRILMTARTGNYSAYIVPDEQGLAVLGPVPLQVREAQDSVVLEVDRMQPIPVEVLDWQGAPVPDAVVQSLDHLPDIGFARAHGFFNPRAKKSMRAKGPRGKRLAKVHSEATTNADGLATVYSPDGQVGIVLNVESLFPRYLKEHDWTKQMGVLMIQLDPLTLFRGHVLNAPRPPGEFGLLVGSVRGVQTAYGYPRVEVHHVVIPDANGDFQVRGIQEGMVRPRLVFPPSPLDQAMGETQWWFYPGDLRTVDFQSEVDEIHEFDLAPFQLGGLAANFLQNGFPFANQSVGLRRTSSRFGGSQLVYQTDSQGKLQYDSLPIGEYQAWLKIGPNWISTQGLATVEGGAVSTVTFENSPRKVTLHLVDETGKPLPLGTEVEITGGWYQVRTIGANGDLVFTSAPREPRRLYVSGPFTYGRSIPFDSLEDQAVYTVVCTASNPR